MLVLDHFAELDAILLRNEDEPHYVDDLNELFEEIEEIDDVPDDQLATVTDMAEFVAAVNAQMGGEG